MSKWVMWVEPIWNSEPRYSIVEDTTAIKMQKEAARKATNNSFEYENDQQALDDFMTVNWAWYCKHPDECR